MEHLINTVNELVVQLNDIMDQYPRRHGNMVMVSADTENLIEGIVGEIEDKIHILKGAVDDEEVEFHAAMEKLSADMIVHREQIAHARDFLSRYYAA